MTSSVTVTDTLNTLNEEFVDDPNSSCNSLVEKNPDHKQEQWPSVWSLDQWLERKSKHPWLICLDQKLGCIFCQEVGCLKTFKKQGVELSKEWISCLIDSGKHLNKKTQLASLRNKIKKHAESSAHLFACNIKKDKVSETLTKSFEGQLSKNQDSNEYIFRTAYFIANHNRPFDDHSKLVELQKSNGVHLGSILHSRYSCTSIINHIACKMRESIVKNIINSESKISVLIDESTTVSSKSCMAVFIKASISHEDPIFIFLDLVKLEKQTAENIVNQLLNCLFTFGFQDSYLQHNWVSFVSDGASVLVGKKNGVTKLLKDKYPLIFSWHCMNHRLELAVNDCMKDVSATNHFKNFIDSLYVLYNRSPKNQNELRKSCIELDILFLKAGRVLDVRWVASSFRAVEIVWKTYPALYNHLQNSSYDNLRDQKSRSKYLGLCKRLGSPEFVLDLALMCDVLKELSYLSRELQSHSITLSRADESIKRTIRVIDSFKTKNGDFMLEALTAQKTMIFKTIVLSSNKKVCYLNHKQFLTSLCTNLNSRLLETNEEESCILNDMQILNEHTWTCTVENIRFGEDEIKRLTNRFLLNTDNAIQGFRKYINNKIINDELKELDILIKTFPVSTAECERGFSQMNLICSDLRSRLSVTNISSLMFININGPPVAIWNPTNYVKSWLIKHRSTHDNRSRKVAQIKLNEEKASLWKIL
ncbi:E3 SUMO-protein ligase KIAA1586-like isoform X2 [Aphis gossypii]|nr:E3 SUMO-protein ligase KIAA1586-like isoform X2 [Aphis gossypii]